MAYNLDTTCRSCLCTSNNLSSIERQNGSNDLRLNNEKLSIGELMTACAEIKIFHDDGLPQGICSKCIIDVQKAYAYKKMCEDSDAKLRVYFQKQIMQCKLGDRIPKTESSLDHDFDTKYFDALAEYSESDREENGDNIQDMDYKNSDNEHTYHFENDDVECDPAKDIEHINLDSIKTYQSDDDIERSDEKSPAQMDLEQDDDEDIILAQNTKMVDGRFPCSFCNRTLIDRKTLKNHIRLHIGKKLKRCTICNQGFTKQSHLNTHIIRHEKKIQCEQRIKTYQSSKANVNCLTKTEPGQVKSPKVTPNKSELIVDDISKVKDNAPDDSYLNTDDEQILQGGDDSVENAPYVSQGDDDDLLLATNAIMVNGRFSCLFCHRTLADRKTLQFHIRLHLGKHLKHCSICNLGFAKQSNLKAHLLRHKHRGECEENLTEAIKKTNAIDAAKKTFARLSAMTPDQLLDKSYRCDICAKAFSLPSYLKRHRKTHNADEKNFACNFCERQFNRKAHLVSHLKVHNSDKEKEKEKTQRYLCTSCGRSFSNTSNLKVHMRIHTGEKPFKCDLCGKAFPRSAELKFHRRIHTGEKPFVCTTCGKGFARTNKLSEHMRTHSGIRPHSCTYCDRTFTQSHDLKIHIRRHTGDKPFMCAICGSCFVQGTDLRQHQRVKGHFDENKQPADTKEVTVMRTVQPRVKQIKSTKPTLSLQASTEGDIASQILTDVYTKSIDLTAN